MRYIKSQTSVEFFTLIALAFLASVFIIVFSANEIKEFRDQKEFFLVKDMTLNLQKEVAIAAFVENGYKRSFDLPDKLDNTFDYFITIRSNSITVNSSKTAYTAAIPNVTGVFTKGTNKIEKDSIGRVYINS